MAIYFGADHVVWAGQAGLVSNKQTLERYAPRIPRIDTIGALPSPRTIRLCVDYVHLLQISSTLQMEQRICLISCYALSSGTQQQGICRT